MTCLWKTYSPHISATPSTTPLLSRGINRVSSVELAHGTSLATPAWIGADHYWRCSGDSGVHHVADPQQARPTGDTALPLRRVDSRSQHWTSCLDLWGLGARCDRLHRRRPGSAHGNTSVAVDGFNAFTRHPDLRQSSLPTDLASAPSDDCRRRGKSDAWRI